MNDYNLGLDIGITSIGWCLIDSKKEKLIDMGVHMFDEAHQAKECRANRQARRTLRRRNWRKQQLKNAFVEFEILSREEIDSANYLSYTACSNGLVRPKDETVYHLRKRALSEKVSKRELLLALYNICGARGHFLMENIDFSHGSISFEDFKEKFYDLTNDFVSYSEEEKFEDEVLKLIFDSGHIKSNDLKKLVSIDYVKDEDSLSALIVILKLLCGFKANLKVLRESYEEICPKTINVLELAKKENLDDFLNGIIELYDMIAVSKILKKYNYICELCVERLNEVHNIYRMEKKSPKEYNERKKQIQSKMNVSKLDNKLRVVKNIENKFPNGLYVKEVRDILKKQKEFYPDLISDNFIEVCVSIIKARIPYYIGPLSSEAKNGWVEKSGNFKYSYDYCKDCSVNEEESILRWKKNMISHCTYLPEEFALPKGSFIAETFSLINELNVLKAIDQNGNDYHLTLEDKVKVFDKLFLNSKDSVSFDEVKDLLGLSYFGTKIVGKMKKFRNKYTLYSDIVALIPEYTLDSIVDIFSIDSRVDSLEELILNLNLFDEEITKQKYLENNVGLDEAISKRLSKLKSKGFYAFSKKFIMDTPMNEQGENLMEQLFQPNSSAFTNEQMTLISKATDYDGKPIYFTSNKYRDLLQKNPKLSIDLLIEDGKPFIPISRTVVRSLNECFKLYEEILRTYGVPKRVVIETARELKDSSLSGEVPAKHFEKVKSCYEYLMDQIRAENNHTIHSCLSSWDDIEPYLEKNKVKIDLYVRQNGVDLITGDAIDLQNLGEYELDHILPRGFGDNSQDNLMLIHRNTNAAKSNRLPLEFIEEECVVNKKGIQITSSMFYKRVNELFGLKLISEKKLNMLCLKSQNDAFDFINRNLVDTRYIIREFMSILKAYNDVKDYDTHVVALKSAFTSTYRKAFDMKKNRDMGDQHHAHDAAVVAIADRVLSTYYPNYDLTKKNNSYRKFLDEMMNKKENSGSEMKKLNYFIRYAYFKTYGHYPNEYDSIVSQVKRLVPLYSVKVEHHYQGEFFNATLYPPKKDQKSVLSILGVNNNIRSFDAINCVAVDFYKYTDKKGNKKHVAIHIPKVIVNANGEINKEKYLKLIREYYKVPELLDESGNIREYYYRMRVFKNDLIYDTVTKTIQKFNVGSIALKKLELKHIYNFSYNNIYDDVRFFKKELATKFDFKLSTINPNGTKKFSDYEIDEIIEFCIDNLMDIDDVDRYKNSIYKDLCGFTKYQEFLEELSFINKIVNRKCMYPSMEVMYKPTIHNKEIKKYPDAEYIKIKSSILGIRYEDNGNDKLIISGPKNASQKYSKIKKEKFTWNINLDVI